MTWIRQLVLQLLDVSSLGTLVLKRSIGVINPCLVFLSLLYLCWCNLFWNYSISLENFYATLWFNTIAAPSHNQPSIKTIYYPSIINVSPTHWDILKFWASIDNLSCRSDIELLIARNISAMSFSIIPLQHIAFYHSLSWDEAHLSQSLLPTSHDCGHHKFSFLSSHLQPQLSFLLCSKRSSNDFPCHPVIKKCYKVSSFVWGRSCGSSPLSFRAVSPDLENFSIRLT